MPASVLIYMLILLSYMHMSLESLSPEKKVHEQKEEIIENLFLFLKEKREKGALSPP